jgi:Endonuclease NucS
MGRRIHVKWDLKTGPLTPDYVVKLPTKAQPNIGIWRPTVSALPNAAFRAIELAVAEKDNWGRLLPGFASERALSEYISASPHLLEDGMVLYPSEDARELVFPDGTRLDVLLLDRDGNITVVECKQDAPSLQNIAQLRGYMRNAEKLNTGMKVGKKIRGILVHGGARKLRPEVRKESRRSPHIELLQFSVTVGFAPSL